MSVHAPTMPLRWWDPGFDSRHPLWCSPHDGTPNACPRLQPCCEEWTTRGHAAIVRAEEWYTAYEGSLLFVELLIIAALQVVSIEAGRNLDLDYATPEPLRRLAAAVFGGMAFMMCMYVVAVWAHLAPNPHTRRAARLATRL